VWGRAFSGGLAIVTAANDPRVRCVVAQIPNVSGHRNAVKLFSAEQLHEIRRRAAIDRRARLAGEPPMMVPMFSDDPTNCVRSRGRSRGVREAIESRIWINETTIRSLENFIEFRARGLAPYVTPKPLLMILAEHDRCTFTEVQREVYQVTPEPKKLLSYAGGHFDAYTTFFEQDRTPGSRLVRRAPGVSANRQALDAPTVGT